MVGGISQADFAVHQLLTNDHFEPNSIDNSIALRLQFAHLLLAFRQLALVIFIVPHIQADLTRRLRKGDKRAGIGQGDSRQRNSELNVPFHARTLNWDKMIDRAWVPVEWRGTIRRQVSFRIVFKCSKSKLTYDWDELFNTAVPEKYRDGEKWASFFAVASIE